MTLPSWIARAALAVVGTLAASMPSDLPAQDNGFSLQGTVRVPGTREPLAGVEVHLTMNDRFQAGTIRAQVEEMAATDANGRFSFIGLPSGRYRLVAQFGDEPPGLFGVRPSRSGEIGGGRLPEDLTIWLSPTSEVAGRVTDPEGRPIEGARVAVRQPAYADGATILDMTAGAASLVVTDENGRYTLAVPEGQYYLRVEGDSFPPHFYPGVHYAEDAIPFNVVRGVVAAGIDVVVDPANALRAEFHIPLPPVLPGTTRPWADYHGQVPFEAIVQPQGKGRFTVLPYEVPLESLDDDRYRTGPLPPGEHDLVVVYSRVMLNAFPDVDWGVLQPEARVRFTLEDEDIDLGTIPELPRLTLSGRIRMRGESARDFEGPEGSIPADLAQASFREAGFARLPRTAAVASDLTFLLDGLYPGLFQHVGPRAPAGWYIASITHLGRDVLREGLIVGGVLAGELEIVMAEDGAALEGVVRDRDDALVPDARIVLIPEARRRGPFLRFSTATADASGAYRFQDVPPGSYRLLALDMAGRTGSVRFWESPEFLREYERRGERITLDPDARLRIDPDAVPWE